MDLSNMRILCRDPRCGVPVPRTGTYRKRRMFYAGKQFSNYVYMCPYCAKKRYFKLNFFGVVRESNGGWVRRLFGD